ncbi:MAG: type VI secretion system-associated protein TagO, partial [Candidatus Thiodiazotropha sp.]
QQPISPNIQDIGKWVVIENKNPIDDSITVTMRLTASTGESKYGDKISLVARCKNNNTEFYINWHDYLGNDAYVLTRNGSNKAVEKEWSISTDKKSSFHPDGTITFLKDMMDSNKFLAQITPYSENPVTAIFDTTGMSNAIKPLRHVCGWSEKDLQRRERIRNKAALKERNDLERRIMEKESTLGKYKEFILANIGKEVHLKLSQWHKLDRTTKNLMDDAMKIYIVSDNDKKAIDLPQ